MNEATQEILLDDEAVAKTLGIGKSTVWRWLNTVPDFPKPIRLGMRTTRWKRSLILDYIDRQSA